MNRTFPDSLVSRVRAGAFSSPVTVEFEMSQRPIAVTAMVNQFYSRKRPVRATPIDVLPKLIKPYANPRSWSEGKQLALLTIAQHLSERCGDCMRHMCDAGIRFSQHDLLDLRNEGLAYKRDITSRFHELTPIGKRLAEEVSDIVAQRLGLHHITYRNGDIRHNGARCSCGWHISADERYGRTTCRIETAVARHLRDPEAWKRGIEGTKAIIERLFRTAEAS